MRILLAVDSFDVVENAVQRFRLHSWPAGVTVEILCVVDKAELASVPRLVESVTARAEELAHCAAEQIRKLGIPSWGTILTGNPKEVIVNHGSETGADFILIGAHEEIGKRRFLLGSVAKAVLRGAHCSVKVLRAPALEKQASRPQQILLATDGSASALLAAKSIASRSWPAGTEVSILSAIEPYTSLFHVAFPPGAEGALRAQAVTRAREAIRQAKEIITGAGLLASEKLSLLIAEPEAIILVEAGRINADLIVVGSHGRRGFNRLLLGSVSETVALHAGCSVEIIRKSLVRSKSVYLTLEKEDAGVPALACC